MKNTNTQPLEPVIYDFIVEKPLSMIRLDHYIATMIPELTRSHIQRLIQLGHATVNDSSVLKSSHVVKPGDRIQLTIPPKPPLGSAHAIPEDLTIPVIFSHPDFFIINKPAGLLVHATSPANKQFSLVDWLIHHFKEIIGVGDQDRPGIVHRLDKDTSGLMIITRNDQAHAKFGEMFHNRTIKKKYYALVQGHPDKQGTIDLPIARDTVHRNRMTTKTDKGRKSVTHYTVQTYYNTAALLDVSPVTGRTHQIRVHCAQMGHPIIGDAVYGKTSPLISRQALHAYHLEFTYNDEPFSFTIGLPNDMVHALELLEPAEQVQE